MVEQGTSPGLLGRDSSKMCTRSQHRIDGAKLRLFFVVGLLFFFFLEVPFSLGIIIESLILLIIKVNPILNPWKLTWIKFCKLPCLIILYILTELTALAFARIRNPITTMPVPWFQPAHTTHFFLGFPATTPEAPAWRKQGKPMWCLPLF